MTPSQRAAATRLRSADAPLRVVVVSEFYPRDTDPVLGVWAHRQALAAQATGAEVRVIVLHRPVPSRGDLALGARHAAGELNQLLRQPRSTRRDGLEVRYVRYLSPQRSRSYASWGAWAAPALAIALATLRRSFAFQLVHAHNAVPAGDAVRRARARVPLVVSVHGGDVLHTAPRAPGGERAVRRALEAADLVLANSTGIERRAREHGARATRVVHLGADLPPLATPVGTPPTLVTLGHLVRRKRHEDVLRALGLLRETHPTLRYEIIGDGPERAALEGLTSELGLSERVTFRGQLENAAAVDALAGAALMVMPSTEEAFGVAYVEAMAAGVPAVGSRGEPGPEEIDRAGEGMLLVDAGDVQGLARAIDSVVGDDRRRSELARGARLTVERAFTWSRCGEQTVAAYRQALR